MNSYPLTGERYQSTRPAAWTIRIARIKYYEDGTLLPEPEVVFVYDSCGKCCQMPISEFRAAYKLLEADSFEPAFSNISVDNRPQCDPPIWIKRRPATGRNIAAGRSNHQWREYSDDKADDDYANYL